VKKREKMARKKDRRIELNIVLTTGGFFVQGVSHTADSAWQEIPTVFQTYGEAVIAMAMLAKDDPENYVIKDAY
jgi:hypothetical protein